MSQVEKLITKEMAANILSRSIGTIDNWVRKGLMPQPKKIGHCVYWHPEVFRQWLDQEFGLNQSTTSAEPAIPRPRGRPRNSVALT